MKNKLIIPFLFFAAILGAQNPRIFTGKCAISQTGGGSGFWQVAVTNFSDPGGQFDATEIDTSDYVYFSDSGTPYSLEVIGIVSASGSGATLKLSNVGITGISSVPTTSAAFVSRRSLTYGLNPFVANLSDNDNQLQQEAVWAKLDSLLNIIDTTGGGGGGSPTDLTFTGAASPYTLNSSTGSDVTIAAGTGMTITRNTNQLVFEATGAGLTSVLNQDNGLDITAPAGVVQIDPDFTEVAAVSVYDGSDVILIKDVSAGDYKQAPFSWWAQNYMDLISNQGAAGIKKFTTGLQWGSGTMPTGIAFGTANQTVFGLKGGTTAYLLESAWQDYGGLVFEANHHSGTGANTMRIIATGEDAAGGKNSIIEFYARPGGSANVNKMLTLQSSGALFGNASVFSTGAGGGVVNVPIGGVGFDGAQSNYRMSGVAAGSGGLGVFENGNLIMEAQPGTNTWTSMSDIRVKSDTSRVVVTPERIRQFKAYTYTLNSSDSTLTGVIAQQIELLYPNLVRVMGGTVDTLGVDYNALAAIAFAACQSLQEQFDERRDTIVSAEIVSDAQTLVKNAINLVNSSGAVTTYTVSPPSSPVAGDWFGVSDSRGTAASHNIIIDFTSAGQKLHGATANVTMTASASFRRFTYHGATVGWIGTY